MKKPEGQDSIHSEEVGSLRKLEEQREQSEGSGPEHVSHLEAQAKVRGRLTETFLPVKVFSRSTGVPTVERIL